MKSVLFILLFIPFFAQSQDFKKWAKGNLASWSVMFAAGATDGINQCVQFHYDKIDAKLNLNDNFCDPSISWKNKYKNGDPQQGPAFFLSTSALVGATDLYHLTRTINHLCIVGAVAFKIGDWKRKWYWYVADIVSFYITYTIAFNITYELLKQ